MGKNDSLRAYCWTFLIYPEHDDSLDQEFIVSKLSAACFARGYVSPLHSPFGDDSERKPHYHVNVKYNTKKSISQVIEDLLSCGFLREWIFIDERHSLDNKSRIHDWVLASRYLAHIDQPEKEQFSEGLCSILSFGGLGDPLVDLANVSETSDLISEGSKYIRLNKIDSWTDFREWCTNERPDLERLGNNYHQASSIWWKDITGVVHDKKKKQHEYDLLNQEQFFDRVKAYIDSLDYMPKA